MDRWKYQEVKGGANFSGGILDEGGTQIPPQDVRGGGGELTGEKPGPKRLISINKLQKGKSHFTRLHDVRKRDFYDYMQKLSMVYIGTGSSPKAVEGWGGQGTRQQGKENSWKASFQQESGRWSIAGSGGREADQRAATASQRLLQRQGPKITYWGKRPGKTGKSGETVQGGKASWVKFRPGDQIGETSRGKNSCQPRSIGSKRNIEEGIQIPGGDYRTDPSQWRLKKRGALERRTEMGGRTGEGEKGKRVCGKQRSQFHGA